VYILTDVHKPPAEGNFCDGHGKAHKCATAEDYSEHMCCNHSWDRMGYVCSFSQENMKVDK
jgi:hypothetical protein